MPQANNVIEKKFHKCNDFFKICNAICLGQKLSENPPVTYCIDVTLNQLCYIFNNIDTTFKLVRAMAQGMQEIPFEWFTSMEDLQTFITWLGQTYVHFLGARGKNAKIVAGMYTQLASLRDQLEKRENNK